MGFPVKIIVKIAANSLALWAAMSYISGFTVNPRFFYSFGSFSPDPLWQTLIIGGAALAAVNMALKPILKVIGAVLPLVTYPILSAVLNIALLYSAEIYLSGITVGGIKSLLLSGGLIGILNALI